MGESSHLENPELEENQSLENQDLQDGGLQGGDLESSDPHRDPARARRRKRIALALGTAALLGVWWFSRSVLGIEFSATRVREMVADLGIWGPFAFVALVTFRLPLGLPSQLVLTAGGLAFGALGGALLGALGLMGSAILAFGVTKLAGPDRALRSLPALEPFLEIVRGKVGGLFVAAVIAYPLGPLTPSQVAAALAGMSLPLFMAASFAGGFVRAALFAYFGDRLVSGDGLIGASVAILVALGVPLLFPKARAWLRTAIQSPSR